jgi:hypothetical protein
LGHEEDVEEGTEIEEELKHNTVEEVKEWLKAMGQTLKVIKQDSVNCLTGKEQLIPHEKQEKSKYKKFIMSQMRFNSFSNKVHWRFKQVTRGFSTDNN